MRHLLLASPHSGLDAWPPIPSRAPRRRRLPSVVAAEFALTNYVDESTRTHGVVCVELDRADDRGKVLDASTPLAQRLSADRSDCAATEPSAILSIGPPQVAGTQARVDVGVVAGQRGNARARASARAPGRSSA
jgi:hypothetical protein